MNNYYYNRFVNLVEFYGLHHELTSFRQPLEISWYKQFFRPNVKFHIGRAIPYTPQLSNLRPPDLTASSKPSDY